MIYNKWVTPNSVQYAHILDANTQTHTHTVSQRAVRKLKVGSYLSHSAISWHFLWISPSLGCVVTCVTPFTVMPSRNIAPWEEKGKEGKQKAEVGLDFKRHPPTQEKQNIFLKMVILSTQLLFCFVNQCAKTTARNIRNPLFLWISQLLKPFCSPIIFWIRLVNPVSVPFSSPSKYLYPKYLFMHHETTLAHSPFPYLANFCFSPDLFPPLILLRWVLLTVIIR